MNNHFQFVKKIPSSVPEIKKTTLFLNSEKDINEGKFETILRSGVLSRHIPIVSLIFNVPIFQLSVNLNPQNTPPRCIVLIGKPIEDIPRDRKIFLIPNEVMSDTNTEHKIIVYWNNWNIIKLEINKEIITESNIF